MIFYQFVTFAGFVFYYAHLFFGVLNNALLFKALAVTFLLATVPLPIITVQVCQGSVGCTCTATS